MWQISRPPCECREFGQDFKHFSTLVFLFCTARKKLTFQNKTGLSILVNPNAPKRKEGRRQCHLTISVAHFIPISPLCPVDAEKIPKIPKISKISKI